MWCELRFRIYLFFTGQQHKSSSAWQRNEASLFCIKKLRCVFLKMHFSTGAVTKTVPEVTGSFAIRRLTGVNSSAILKTSVKWPVNGWNQGGMTVHFKLTLLSFYCGVYRIYRQVPLLQLPPADRLSYTVGL